MTNGGAKSLTRSASVYVAFAAREQICAAYWEHFFAADALKSQLRKIVNSGVRNDGLLNLNARDFFRIRVAVPPLSEQVTIATALDIASTELRLLRAQLKALKKQEASLMERLLSGSLAGRTR